MANLEKLGGKRYIGKGALGDPHVPAAFPPRDNPTCMAPKPENTDVSERPKPSEPVTSSGISGGREVKPVPREPGAVRSKAVWMCRLQNYKLLLANCVAAPSAPKQPRFPFHPCLAFCWPTPLWGVWMKHEKFE